MIEWTGREVDNIITGIAQIGMLGKTDLLEELRPGLEKCNAEVEEILSNEWFNAELMKEWKKNKKHKPDIEAIK